MRGVQNSRHTHQNDPTLGFLSGAPVAGKSVVDGAGMANHRPAVAAADWESVGKAWALGPEWSPAQLN